MMDEGRGVRMIELQGFTYGERQIVVPELTSSFAECGGWVRDRRSLSASSVEFRMEVRLADILELYTSMLAAGLEMTRLAHLGLTELCTCRQHLESCADLRQVISIRLEVSFLGEAAWTGQDRTALAGA